MKLIFLLLSILAVILILVGIVALAAACVIASDEYDKLEQLAEQDYENHIKEVYKDE